MYNPQLDTFLLVADAGSFSKAAEQAFITPHSPHETDQPSMISINISP